MKIGVLVALKRGTDIDAELIKLRDNGFNCCQISCWDPSLYTRENAEQIRASAEKHGIEITALWAGWTGPCEWNFTYGPLTIGLVPAAYRAHRLSELLQASDFALMLGTTDIITHVGFIPENPYDPDFQGTVGALRRLAKTLQARGQNFLFETGQETPVTVLRAIEAIGTPNLGINLDTGNLILYGKANPADAIDVFGQYIRNTHFKDGLYPTNGVSLGKEVPLGEGRANVPLVIKKLLEVGYSGPWIIEREIKDSKQLEGIIAARDLILNTHASISDEAKGG